MPGFNIPVGKTPSALTIMLLFSISILEPFSSSSTLLFVISLIVAFSHMESLEAATTDHEDFLVSVFSESVSFHYLG